MGLKSSAGGKDSSPAAGQTQTAVGHVTAGAVSVNENRQRPPMSEAELDAHQEMIAQASYVMGAKKGEVQATLRDARDSLLQLVTRDLLDYTDVVDKLRQAVAKHGDEGRKAAQAVLAFIPLPGGKGSASDAQPAEKPKTAQQQLLELANKAELFHGPDGTAYASFIDTERRDTYSVRSTQFRQRLLYAYFKATGGTPNADSMTAAINTIEARAVHDGVERETFLRTARHDRGIYIDLADRDRRAIEITGDGWKIVATPPVYFLRPAGILPLPEPTRGGSLEPLRTFLNVGSDEFTLILGWLHAALSPFGPYPILVDNGVQGGGKSTRQKMLQALVDPHDAIERSLPRDERDLSIVARKQHLVAFGNISGLPPGLADAFCRLSTGGTLGTRALHTDSDEVLFKAKRPIMLNGIPDLATRGDLLERAIINTPKPIPSNKRRAERELWDEFEAARPGILGALLDGLVRGLNGRDSLKPGGLPRMADFALWAVACEGKGWEKSKFLEAYNDAADEAAEALLEGNSLAVTLMSLASSAERLEDGRKIRQWRGTATKLLEVLTGNVIPLVSRGKDWPKSEDALGAALRRLAPALLKVGIVVDRDREKGKKRTRVLVITDTSHDPAPEIEGEQVSAASEVSERVEKQGSATFSAADTPADTSPSRASAKGVRRPPPGRQRVRSDTPGTSLRAISADTLEPGAFEPDEHEFAIQSRMEAF
jgi:hypothetical protein